VRRQGFTLIEMVVALAIIAVLFSAVIIGVGSLTGAKAKEAATELTGVIRSLYDTANLTGKTCRLVFELPAEKDEDGAVTYHAECAKSGLTATKNREEEQKDARTEGERRKKKDRLDDDDKRFTRSDSDEAPTLQELMAREKARVDEAAKFSTFTTEEIPARTLPGSVRVWVWTKALRTPTKSGPAYLYFFPQGFTDRAQVYVRQGNNVWTLSVSPLTGKVATAAEELEVPRS
jgi:general secretion pathway protein H